MLVQFSPLVNFFYISLPAFMHIVIFALLTYFLVTSHKVLVNLCSPLVFMFCTVYLFLRCMHAAQA